MSSSVALRVCALGHRYGPDLVLQGVSFEVARGELLSVLGVSGSGKSTLLRSIAGFARPVLGRIDLFGQTVVQDGEELVAAEKRGVGMVFQDYALFANMTVAENIAFGIQGRSCCDDRVRGLLSLLGLASFASRRPAELSGGQQQRVALARALAPKPSVVLLDEPFANLDAQLREELGKQIRATLHQEGVAALLVTHSRHEALGLADRVLVLGQEGIEPSQVLQIGRPDEVYRQPSSAQVAHLTGDAFLLAGELKEGCFNCVFGGYAVADEMEGPATGVVRPEAMTFLPDAQGDFVIEGRRFVSGRFELTIRSESLGRFVVLSGRDDCLPGLRGHVELGASPHVIKNTL